ncbi:TetR/AcrR family transcriptional regulator [Amycolatopsis sp. NBC_01286]|uniref:TetR/AcrR family transcriptional regulator n=1 Tax=Amycolatopsis sp. NBC_01286 TaxID=2903560 RepID=UPI002E0E59BE|nr:TetR/AcrR family transcriptional regulator [Amycolatopsis sp. NBC_01286]
MPPADDTPEPRSRRDRPAKAALTRQGIIDTALGILRDEGLEKVTMRRVAAALDSGHASLYVYVRNTEDLHAQILDVLLGELQPSVTGPGTWRDRVKGLLSGYGQLLMRYPGIARMALSTQPSGPNYLALVDTVLALLQEGGAHDRAAAWGVDLLLLFPTAVAVEFSAPAAKTEKAAALSALATKITTVDAARYPHIAPLSAALVSGDGGSRSDWAFDVLLDGILAANPPPAPEQDLP